MLNYKIYDRIIYNPTFSYTNFLTGVVLNIENQYLYIKFDNNDRIFKVSIFDVCLENTYKKIIIKI
jgi:hypothetical protein